MQAAPLKVEYSCEEGELLTSSLACGVICTLSDANLENYLSEKMNTFMNSSILNAVDMTSTVL